MNPVTAFFCLLQFLFYRCFFLASLWRKAGCNDGDLCRFFHVFHVSFLACGWIFFFCTKCTRLFSSPLPVLSRIHRDGDRSGERAVSLPHPFYLLHRKKKITFCPVLKKGLDNLIFVFILNTSVWLNRIYWSGSPLNRAVDYCAPSMPTKKTKTKNRVHFFWQNLAALKMVTTLDEWWPFFILLRVPKKIKEQH